MSAEKQIEKAGKEIEPTQKEGNGEPTIVDSDLTKELAKLNRHWYRRCLDSLTKDLQKVGSSPTIEEFHNLCDQVVSRFLEAVTSQARDADVPQFPADRAFFIPFESDRAGRFNYSKTYYQLLNYPSALNPNEKLLRHSLWSFLPWFDKKVKINPKISTDVTGSTGSFQTLLLPREEASTGLLATSRPHKSSDGEKPESKPLLLRKSLLLRGETLVPLSSIRADLRKKTNIKKDLIQALTDIFELYRSCPGDPDIELILVNQFYVVRWLTALCGLEGDDGSDALSTQRKAFKKLIRLLLHGYFLGSKIHFKDVPTKLLDKLVLWVAEETLETEDEQRDQSSKLPTSEITKVLFKHREVLGDGRFIEELQDKVGQASTERTIERPDREIRGERESEEDVEHQESIWERIGKNDLLAFLNEVKPHFTSFYRYFLKPNQEEELEDRFEARSVDDPRRSGDTDSSFVWVCPDFEDLGASLPKSRTLEISEEKSARIQALLNRINKPYREFFQLFEIECLRAYSSKISNYWRTRGEASRKERIFASFKDSKTGLFYPPTDLFKEKQRPTDPYPQNIFLRVRICDSLNEPVIDGLFVFSTDYDESTIWDKAPALRQEDTEDLLAFSKVFFFIVRDYVHSLDRARDASDIGRLNQYLFDRRLQTLETSLESRLATYDQRSEELTRASNWDRLIYEVLNSYAQALIDKPDDVRNETFPYDRLFILPIPELGTHFAENSDFDLPFYLFQAIFVECEGEKIDGTHYSLLKPFQSPIEEIDAREENRFRSRSFQKEFETEEGFEKLLRYLEKHYVGTREQVFAEESAERSASESEDTGLKDRSISSVVKATESESGKTWAAKVLEDFWSLPESDLSVDKWCNFLSRLTSDYRDLQGREEAVRESVVGRRKSARLWFLFRFGLLRALLRQIPVEDKRFSDLKNRYDSQELELKFGNRPDLDILWLAGGPQRAAHDQNFKKSPPELFRVLVETPVAASSKIETRQNVAFAEYFLTGSDSLTLRFFEFLTQRICNYEHSDTATKEREAANFTWYQPTLTRPLKGKLKVHQAIGTREPQYSKIQNEEDSLAMFIGAVSLRVGRSERETRKLRSLVVMIRDFDDSKVLGIYQSDKEIKERLQDDLRDLQLFTSTFFQAAERTLNTARERQQVRLLSTDIQQIARNWYSDGMDMVVDQLEEELRIIGRRPDKARLNRLQPEMVQRLFDSVSDVLLREEKTRETNLPIKLESFPFDRILHVPLLFGSREAACLSYIRAGVEGLENKNEDAYDIIRREGRHVVLGAGKKKLLCGPNHVLSRDHLILDRAVGHLKNDSRLDFFIRRLYQANTLQTLALGGVLNRLLDRHNETRDSLSPKLRRAREVLNEALQSSIRSVEQQLGISGGSSRLATAVSMDAKIRLPHLGSEGDDNNTENAASYTQRIDRFLTWHDTLPYLKDLFEALESGQPGWEYGLGEEIFSKIFYVYYSVPAPAGFLESFTFEAHNPRYRGVFCFVVDDASTDDKSSDKAAERADQEDIRTFVHNVMGSLRLVLEQQALEERLNQPGVEQFVNGMLHRLKNELNEPVKAFEVIEGVLRSWGADRAEEEGVLERIRTAQGTIGGVRQIFQKLKGISEHDFNLLRNFSSGVLGWYFIESLCSASLKEITRQVDQRTAAQKASVFMEKLRSLEENARRRRTKVEVGHDSGGHSGRSYLPEIERQLHRLETLLEAYFAEVVEEIQLEARLSYDVFNVTPLVFRGGSQLPEALNILFENAFQAAWSHAFEEAESSEAKPTLRVALVCRRNEEQRGEILIAIENSSREIDPEFLSYLNAETPQPISARRYQTSGGGKKGGSGFGHYFARRIIREYCGGRDARRQLDVQVEPVPEHLARVRVNLLEAKPAPPRLAKMKELFDSAWRIFDDLRGGIEEISDDLGPDAQISLPADVEALALMQAIHSLLEADRRLKEEQLLSLAKNRLCRDLGTRSDKIRREIGAFLDVQVGAGGKGKAEKNGDAALWTEMRIELNRGAVRPGSFHDLKTWLEKWSRRDASLLRGFAESVEGMKAPLSGLVDSGRFGVFDVLTAKQKKRHQERFEPFEPFLRDEAREEGLACLARDLQRDANGRPGPSPEVISRLLTPQSWKLERGGENGWLQLEFRLEDGQLEDGEKQADDDATTSREVNVIEAFPNERMAPTFAQYQRSLAEGNGSKGDSTGMLTFVRRLTVERTSAKAHHVVGRSAILELALEVSGSDANDTHKGDPS